MVILHQVPDAAALSRTLAKIPLSDLQKALTALFYVILSGESDLTVAVDGKTSKQLHQADGNVIHMLNLFSHDFNLYLSTDCVIQ